MTTTLTYKRRSIERKTLDFHTENSILFSDLIFMEAVPKECADVYVRDERRIRRRFDSGDWKDVAASLLSQWRSKRDHNAASDRKEQMLGLDKENLLNSHTRTSSHSSGKDGASRKRNSKESPKPRVRPRRKCTQRSTPNYQKAVSASSRSRRKKSKAASVLREPLFNKVLDHCLQNIWMVSPEEQRNQFAHISCLSFYMYEVDFNREKVLSWIKRDNMLSKKYIFVPILMWSHWTLLILCHLGESLDSKTTTPCMLLLDSLQECGSPPKLEPLLRRFVSDIFETCQPESKDMVQDIPFLVPKVPQQRNGKECGIFTLYYASLFLKHAPESFSIHNGYPYFLKEDWFTEEELEGFYKRLESLGVQSSDSEGSLGSGSSEGIEYLYTEAG